MMYTDDMARMVRKQVYLAAEHDRLLKNRSRKRGVTEAEVIREAIAALETRGQRAIDPAAAGKALGFMRSLARRRGKREVGRDWTRESLYDDRLARWPKS